MPRGQTRSLSSRGPAGHPPSACLHGPPECGPRHLRKIGNAPLCCVAVASSLSGQIRDKPFDFRDSQFNRP